MKAGKVIAQLRDQKGWSQNELATKAGVSHVMIGKYERGDAMPSLEVANKIANVLEVSLDYLVGEAINANLDKQNLKRLEELELLESDKRKVIYDLIDTYKLDKHTLLKIPLIDIMSLSSLHSSTLTKPQARTNRT